MEQSRFNTVRFFLLVGLFSLGAAACNEPGTRREPTMTPGVTSAPAATQISVAPTIEPTIAALQLAVHPPETRTGFPELDAIIDAVLAHDVEALRGLTQYTHVGCTHADGLGGPPKCLEGEAEDTMVEVVPFLGSEGHHQRRVDYELWSGPDVRGLLAAYRVSTTALSEEAYPPGEVALVFLDVRGIAGVTLQVRGGRVVRYDFDFPGSVQSDLEHDSAEIILPLNLEPVPTAMPWNQFEDPSGRFGFFYPPTMAIDVGSSENTWRLGDRIEFTINTTNAYWVGCLEQSLGDCPLVEDDEFVDVNGLQARRLKGWFGAVGGRIPQEYLTYIFEVGDEYLVFTLYALSLGTEQTDITTIWPLEGMQVELLERSLKSLMLLE